MKLYRNLARISAAAAVFSMTVSAYAYSDYMVTVDSLKSGIPEMVDFSSVITENDALVPVRELVGETGMYASWNQPTQTATITLYSCAWGQNKIERYASELMKNVNTYGLDVVPYSITADFGINDNVATLRYNYKDSDDDIISIGKQVEISDSATLVNDGTLIVPLKSSMEMFGLDVNINNSDMSANISIPEYAQAPSDMDFMADKSADSHAQAVTASAIDVTEESGINMDPSLGKYLGRFLITHYCPCSICNGGWGANTAWAGKVVPGQTIAVDPDVIPKLSEVYIDGYGYRTAEDCGGSIKGNHIDMAVSTHSEAISKGTVYKDVYLVN